jgi:hypothetical protein
MISITHTMKATMIAKLRHAPGQAAIVGLPRGERVSR